MRNRSSITGRMSILTATETRITIEACTTQKKRRNTKGNPIQLIINGSNTQSFRIPITIYEYEDGFIEVQQEEQIEVNRETNC